MNKHISIYEQSWSHIEIIIISKSPSWLLTQREILELNYKEVDVIC